MDLLLPSFLAPIHSHCTNCSRMTCIHNTVCSCHAQGCTASSEYYKAQSIRYGSSDLQGEAFSTIHITPEEACCYASVELTGCPDMEPAAFIAKVCLALETPH